MLEQLIKLLFALVMISFFIITCIKVINDSVENSLNYLSYDSKINDLRNGKQGGNSSFLVCMPVLINNTAGRSCIA